MKTCFCGKCQCGQEFSGTVLTLEYEVPDLNSATVGIQGPVVQSVVSLMSLLRVISLTVLTDSVHNIQKFLAEKMWDCKSYSHFFSKKFQHICVSLDVNFNESLTKDIVSFEQLGPDCVWSALHCTEPFIIIPANVYIRPTMLKGM